MPDYNDTLIPFRPVRCREEDIETLSPNEGYVLFTTDTKKIYACVDNEYKMMGGSSGVFYGKRELSDAEKVDQSEPLTFLPQHFDDPNNLPNEDDLILNIPDGGFYRVLFSDGEGTITAQRIAVSGNGSGGSGGEGGGTAQGSLIITTMTNQNSSTIAGKDYYIEFTITATDAAGDPIVNDGTATWTINGKTYSQVVSNGYNKFKVDEYLDPTISTNKIVLVVSMDVGGATNQIASKTWRITCVDLSLNWDWIYSPDNYIKTKTFSLAFTPNGGTNCTAHIMFDGIQNEGVTYFTKSVAARETGKTVYFDQLPAQEHGSHTATMWLTAVVNGEEYETDKITHTLTFVDESNSAIILTVPFDKQEVTQYETLQIPFLVYNPKEATTEVTFKVNGGPLPSEFYDNTLHYWPYTPTMPGSLVLEISAGMSASKTLEMIVNELELDANEVTGYNYALKAKDLSSNSELKSWESNGVTLTFSNNFDWDNGGLKTETLSDGTIQKYICVRQGTTMTINHKHFGTAPTKDGSDFKICFKATNCYSYDATVLDCYDDSGNMGLRMNAQSATFSTAAIPNFNTQYYEDSYIELEAEIWPDVADTVITSDKSIYGDRYLMFWIDGVPAGIKAYDRGAILYQSNPQNIVIGSSECDVWVYLVKSYPRKLTENEHLENFIMDAPNTTEMMARYRRNDILDSRGEISYEKLVQNNPSCHAYIYEMDRMTKNKNDKIKNCTYYELYGDNNTIDNPYYKTENATIYVQGTSSAAYGVAAFNLRTKFDGDLYDKNGDLVSGWKPIENVYDENGNLIEKALPIQIACTKVNVASCENGNNVINVDWYNENQPYHDAHRRKGLGYRDCMQFNTGVIFVKDNNATTDYYNDKGEPDTSLYLDANIFLDTKNYTSKPYYKMYAIGNMGNDKKNSEIFHDTENPKACCLEIRDNQGTKFWLTDTVTSTEVDDGDLYYEFRYPDGNENATNEQKQGWVDFVNWMASMDPSPYDETKHPHGATGLPLKRKTMNITADNYVANKYYIINSKGQLTKATGDYQSNVIYYDVVPGGKDDPLVENIVFEPYTIKGFTPPNAPIDPNPTGVSLKGTKITTYATTKTVTQPKVDEDGNWVTKDDGHGGFEYVYETIETEIPYQTDSTEYRMARMLSECEDHLVLDSIIYHYLFLERHTMVDNVAKNAFWSTEDLIHWDLTKNYDNDTSDGNNNSGYLTFTYGLEIFDKVNGGDIFNASESVWLNFAHNLPEAQKALYQQLSSGEHHAWNAKEYLEKFDTLQNAIPERCWIQDYMRKYIRPRRLGLDKDTYLERLEGGKKTHQRKQYETYQQFYTNSKYLAGNEFNDSTSLDMRLNAPADIAWDQNNTIPVSFYIDCYASGKFGGLIIQSGRLKRGEKYGYPIGQVLQSPHDATCYIYGANMIQTLEDISNVYPSYANFLNASRLREVAVGADDPYYNNYLRVLNVSSNAMMEKAQLQNIGDTSNKLGNLDLTAATQLQELNMHGSAFTGLSLAEDGIITKLHINDINQIKIKGLHKIESLEVDEGIYKNLTNFNVEDCPAFDDIMYKAVLAKSEKEAVFYRFVDFDWTVSDIADLVVEGGKVTGIKVLDILNTKNPQTGYTKDTALIGNININVACELDEYDLYTNYVTKFPNVTFTLGEQVTGKKAYELVFKSSSEDNATTHYRVLNDGTMDVQTSISALGPTGIAMEDPETSSNLQETYTFTGYWTDQDNKKYYRDGLEDPIAGAINFSGFIPTKSYTFTPVYNISVTVHEVKVYDYDKNVIETVNVPYGSVYNGSMVNYWYKEEDSNIKSNQRYGFKGWITGFIEVGKGRNVETIDITSYVVKGPINFYPYYEVENVEEVPTNPDYFNIDKLNKAIYLKEEYRNLLAGKITIPGPEDFSGNPDITTVSKMTNNGETPITHVYFKKGSSNYTSIGSSAFRGVTTLEEVHLPESITTLESSCFHMIASNSGTKLKYMNLENITKFGDSCLQYAKALEWDDNLNENTTQISGTAFYYCQNVHLTKLPDALKTVGMNAFSFSGVKINKFGGANSKLELIGNSAFSQVGNTEITEIYFGNGVKTIGNNAFANYAKNLNKVYFKNSETSYSNTFEDMFSAKLPEGGVIWDYQNEID